MKALAYISSFLSVFFLFPLMLHAVMPESQHWLSGEQIGGCVMGFVIFLNLAGGIFVENSDRKEQHND